MRARWFVALWLVAAFDGRSNAQSFQGVFVYAAVASDYRFYGISESNREPVEQGGVHWIMPERFYIGVFASRVRFKDFRNTSYEIDLYGGRHFAIGANDLNAELLYSMFPDQAAHAFYRPKTYVFPTYNFAEASAELSRRMDGLTLFTKGAFSPAYGSHAGVMLDADAAASYTLRSWLSVDTRIGRQWIARGIDRTHWEAGITATWWIGRQSLALDVRYFGTDLGRAQCFNQNWCGPSAVVKATYGVAL